MITLTILDYSILLFDFQELKLLGFWEPLKFKYNKETKLSIAFKKQ